MTNPRAALSETSHSSNSLGGDFSKGESVARVISIDLPWPPSVNRIWRRGKNKGVYLDPKYVAWRKEADTTIMARRQSLGRMIEGHCTVSIIADVRRRYTKKGKLRKIDIDNRKKVVLDCLERMRVIAGDHLIDKASIEWGVVEGVRVTVCPV